jgi:hypothetical protein
MQTIAWMADSDSVHFSEQLSYIKLFISSYSLKDINFASLTHLQEFFQKKQRNGGSFLTEGKGIQPGSLTGGARLSAWI